MAVVRDHIVETIPVKDIMVADGRRAVNEEAVKKLADSIKTIGLQTPITIRCADIPDPTTGEILEDAWVVVAGRHRLEACRRLGHSDILAIVRDCDEIDADLWEIDENLCRADLGEAEQALCHARRKELWSRRAARDAENNIVPNGDKKPGRPKTGDFARDTAKVTGESKTSVARKIERGEKIAPDVLAAITGGRWDKGVVLDILKKLTHAEQRQALFRVKNGASHSFEDAYDFIRGDDPHAKPKPIPKPPAPLNDIETMDKWLAAGMAWWNRGSKEWREEFLSRIETPVLGNAGETRPRVKADEPPGGSPKKPPATPYMDEDIPTFLQRKAS